MASGSNRNFLGFYRGTGAAQTIGECGFSPRSVKVTSHATGASVELARDEDALLSGAGGLASSPADLDWRTGIAVASDAATLTAAGPVMLVEATAGASTGPLLVQSSAAPAQGAVRVVYTDNVATLTFNATDAVTECAVMLGDRKVFLSAAEGLVLSDASGFSVGTDDACNAAGVSYRFEAQD